LGPPQGYKTKGFAVAAERLEERPSVFIRDKPILSLERMLHKDYYHKSSVGKEISGRGLQRA
jgi:hypothetical protein